MKKLDDCNYLDTYYSTSSYGGTEGRDYIKVSYISEETAREEALKDNWNSGYELYRVDRYVTPEGMIVNISNFMARIPSLREPEKHYFVLYGIDENNEKKPIYYNDEPLKYSTKELSEIYKNVKFDYYQVYRVEEKIIDGKVKTTEVLVSTLPGKRLDKTTHYVLYGINRYGAENFLADYSSLEDLNLENIISIITDPKWYVEFKIYEVVVSYDGNEPKIEKREIQQIINPNASNKRKK